MSECTLFEQPRSFFCKKCWFTEVEIQFSFLLQWTRASATSSAKTHRKEYLNHVIADVDIAKSGKIRGWKCTIEGFILAYLKIVDMNWRASVAEGQLDKKIQTIFLLLANVYQTASLSVWNGAAYIYLSTRGWPLEKPLISHYRIIMRFWKGVKHGKKRILDLEKSVDNMQMMWGRWIPSFVNVNCMQCYISCLGWR